jgi:hypothetical protein
MGFFLSGLSKIWKRHIGNFSIKTLTYSYDNLVACKKPPEGGFGDPWHPKAGQTNTKDDSPYLVNKY